MKILMINYEFPPLGGGGGNATMFVSKELVQMGHQVTVLTSGFRDLPAQELRDGYSIIRVPVLRRRMDRSNVFEMALFVLKGFHFIKRLTATERPDKTVAFFSLPSGPLAYYLHKKHGTPYDIYLQGGDVPGFPAIGFLAERIHDCLKPLTRKMWTQATSVVANSAGLAEIAGRSWNGTIQVIPNGVDTAFFTPPPTPRTGKPVTFLFVGRFAEQKGLLPFLDVLKDFECGKRWRFVMVGDGPLRSDIENKVRENVRLRTNVQVKHWLSKEELVIEYQSADVFVLPSIEEGMANVLTEAMACGLPILATAVAGSSELARHDWNGFSYTVGQNPSGYLSRLVEEDSLRQIMGQRGRETAESMSWKNIAECIAHSSTHAVHHHE